MLRPLLSSVFLFYACFLPCSEAQGPHIDGPVTIVARHSNLSLDVRDAGGELSLVQTAGNGGQLNRWFVIRPIGGGFYNIIAAHSRLSLDVKDAGGEMALVQTAGDGGQPNREWEFRPVPGGYFNIIARHSGLGLDVKDAGGEMALLQTAGMGGQPNREFSVIPVKNYEFHGISINASLDIRIDRLRSIATSIPPDGKVVTVTLSENVWPDEKIAFEKNESVEFALGTKLRAKQKHRNPENGELEYIGPGLVAEEGYLVIQGGWRAKKKLPIDDHLDGTFKLKLLLKLNAGKLEAKIEPIEVNWDGRGPIMTLYGIIPLGPSFNQVVEQSISDINKKLDKLSEDLMATLLKEYPQVRLLGSITSLEIVKDKIRLIVRTPL